MPLLVVNLILFPGSRSFTLDHSITQLNIVADLKTEQIRQWLDQGRQVAQMITISAEIHRDLTEHYNSSEAVCECAEQLRAELRGIAEVFPAVAAAELLDPETGRVMFATELTHEGRIRFDEDFFTEGSKRLFVSPVAYSVGSEAPVQVVSAPIFNDQGAVMAVAAVELNFDNLHDTIVNQAGLGYTGQAYLVDAYGFFVTVPQSQAGSPLRTIARSEGVSRATAGEDGSDLYTNYDGIPVLGVYRWLPDVSLGLLVEMAESEIGHEIEMVWGGLALTSAGVLVLALFSGRYMTDWLVQPLEMIGKAARALQAGDLNQRVPPSQIDEIGQLGGAFNEMADALQQSYNNLEDQVAQRTAELQQALEKLSDSEERFQRLVNLAREGIIIHERGYIMDCNPALLQMFDYDSKTMTTLTVVDLVAPESYEVVKQNMRSSEEHTYEVIARRSDGSRFPAEVHSRRVPYMDRHVRVVGVRDLTERKMAEQRAIELAMERERVNILARFVTGASHEFRTPLSVINTKAYLMERVDDLQRRASYRETINLQVDNLTHLIDDLVILTRLETEPDLHIQPVDMHRLLREVYRRQSSERIMLDLPGDLPGIQADEEMLQLALNKIVDNALSFTPEPGTVYMQATSQDDTLTIEIRDTGIGMTEAVLSHIFERFYRADTAHSTRGFGLGLPIAQKIIQLHRGNIAVSSETDAGTIITITLPDTIVLRPKSGVSTP